MNAVRQHTYLTQDQFRDPMFIRIRRRVWLILLPYTEGEGRKETERLIAIYNEILDGGAKDQHYDDSALTEGSSQSGMASPLRKPFKRPFPKRKRALTGAPNRLPPKGRQMKSARLRPAKLEMSRDRIR